MNFDLNAEETEAILAIRSIKDNEDIHISRKKDGSLDTKIYFRNEREWLDNAKLGY